MKKRLITAAIGIGVAVAWLFTMYTPVYSIVLSIVSMIATYEMLKVFDIKNIVFRTLCLLSSACVILYADYKDKISVPLFLGDSIHFFE